MTESEGSFLFRKQFDVTAKKIVCKKEPDALSDFLNFLENHNRCFLISIDEETIAILKSKLQKSFPSRLENLKIKGFTYWRRSLRKLDIPQLELEENIKDGAPTFFNALTIAKVLKAAFYKILRSDKVDKDVFSMYHHCLSISKLKSPHRHRVKSCNEEIVIDISSSYRNISSCITGRKMQQVFLDSDSETEDCEKLPVNEPNDKEYFEPVDKIKSESITISSDSEDGIEIIPTTPAQNPARPVETENPWMICSVPKEGPSIQCHFCHAKCKSKNLLKHYNKVHHAEMSKRCIEAFNEFLRSGHDGELELGAAISFIHRKHKEIPQKIIKDFVTYKRHFLEAAKKQETTAGAGFASQNLQCNLGRGMGTFVELGGGHQNQSAWNKAQQKAALQAQVMDQLRNQPSIDLLRLKKKDFATYRRHFLEAAKKQETTKDGAMDNTAGLALQSALCNLGRGMGTFVEFNQAQHRAALQAPAMDQLQNQGLIDLLRLKIASVRGQINIRLPHPSDPTGYNTLAQLYREEAKLQQQLYKYLQP